MLHNPVKIHLTDVSLRWNWF